LCHLSVCLSQAGGMHSCLVFTKVVLVNKCIHLFMYFSTKGGLVVEVKVGYFLVFFCGEG
jgi:hypothetical protein